MSDKTIELDYPLEDDPTKESSPITYISLGEWEPFFLAWIDRGTLNFGGHHFVREPLPSGRVTLTFKEHFTGFHLNNPQHRLSWRYVVLRATIDYCTAKDLPWTLNSYRSMELNEYKVQDHLNFPFTMKNILSVNERIYKNNSVPFPKNARQVFSGESYPMY